MRGHRIRLDAETTGKRTVVALCLLSAVISVVISGCGAASVGIQSHALKVSPATPGPDPAASTLPADASTAAAITSRIADALNSLAAETSKPDAEALRAAFESAGVDADSVEVSIDTTPTGLEVDAMTAAVPVGETCVFGHVRDGTATATQLPALSDGRCFVGDQR